MKSKHTLTIIVNDSMTPATAGAAKLHAELVGRALAAQIDVRLSDLDAGLTLFAMCDHSESQHGFGAVPAQEVA